MTSSSLSDYLAHMRQAIADAQSFTEGMAQPDFEQDKRTQQAVVMSLIVLGEAATKVMDKYPEFAAQHAGIPWHNMRGMRNRIAHGYFILTLVLFGKPCKLLFPRSKSSCAPLSLNE